MAAIQRQKDNQEHLDPRYSYMAQALRGVYLPPENQDAQFDDQSPSLDIVDLIGSLPDHQYRLMAQIINATPNKGGA